MSQHSKRYQINFRFIGFYKIQMGCPTSRSDKRIAVPEPQELFKANLRSLHKRYVEIVLHMRTTRIFKQRTQKLQLLVDQYISNNFKFDENNLDIASIDSVIKLHPIDCKKPQKLTKQWIIESCLRQDKFSIETAVQRITFDHAYPEYLQFLDLCRGAVGTKKITVPTKCQDIIWHSHMQDVQHYESDMRKYVGIFLNHRDDFPDDQLKEYTKQTWQRKGMQYKEPQKNKIST